jgi:hypothetical protein
MNSFGKRKVSAPDPGEAAIVDLLQQHIDEATSHELDHKALISRDRDRRHVDPLKSADCFARDPHPQKPPRKFF